MKVTELMELIKERTIIKQGSNTLIIDPEKRILTGSCKVKHFKHVGDDFI